MASPRNIILLVADSLRYDSLHGRDESVDGSGLRYTAANGVTFTQARSAGCWTLPATASLFTGLMPHEHGADAQSRAVRAEVPTLAERLREAGWGTAQVTANVATSEIFGLDRGFDKMHRVWQLVPARHRKTHEVLVLVGKPRLRRMILSPEFVAGKLAEDLEASKVWLQNTIDDAFELARKALDEFESAGKRGFLFVNLMETHFPYHVGSMFETTAAGVIGKLREVYSLYHLINQTWMTTGQQPIAPDMLELLRERQRLAWQRIAAKIDAFVKELHERGNLVVFGADHGDNFGEHGWLYHFSNVTDAGNRVPLYWLSPDGEAAGRRVTTPMSTRDVYGGILAEAGVDRTHAHPVSEPERSFPIMQSCWYNNNGRTLPQYKFNQICMLEGGKRWLRRRNEWFVGDPAAGGVEPSFERLAPGFDPLEEGVIASERRPYLRGVLRDFEEYSRRVGV